MRPSKQHRTEQRRQARKEARTSTSELMRNNAARRSKARMTGAQRDSRGRMSDWSRSVTYFDARERDVRWSSTISG